MTYTTEAIACGLSDVAGWLENEGGREVIAAARAEYDRWSTGGDTSRPAGERNWACRQNDNGTWAITTYHQYYDEADRARHEQALAAAISVAALGTGEGSGGASSVGPAGQTCLDAAAAIEGIAQELDAYGRTAQGHMLRQALDVLLDVQSDEQLPPADAGTKRSVDRAWARFQAAAAQGTEAEGRNTAGGSVHEGPVGKADAPSPPTSPQAPNTLSEVEEYALGRAHADGIRAADWTKFTYEQSLAIRLKYLPAAIATLRAPQEQDGEVRNA